jgi:Type II CAAX prenyl endopeptidase Rce1-like
MTSTSKVLSGGSRSHVLAAQLALLLLYFVASALFSAPPTTPSIAGWVLRVALRGTLEAGFIFALLRWSDEGPVSIGLQAPSMRTILGGTGLGVALFAAFSVVLNSLLHQVYPESKTDTATLNLIRDPNNFLAWVCLSSIAGFGEELLRILSFTRVVRLAAPLGRAANIVVFGGIVTESVFFGLHHRYQGTAGMVSATLFGITMAALYWRRRCAAELMIAHAVRDVLAVGLAVALQH